MGLKICYVSIFSWRGNFATSQPSPIYGIGFRCTQTSCYVETDKILWIVISSAVLAFPAFAQTPPTLDLHLFAGVNITGTTGTVYAVESHGRPGANKFLGDPRLYSVADDEFLMRDTSAPVGDHRFYRRLQNPPTNMVFVPANTFRMGSPTNEFNRTVDEGPQTTVIISRGFWIAKYEVTQGEYVSLMHTNPSFFPGDLSRPVSTVSWIDATNYCAQLTQQELAAGRIPAGTAFRLPTEAEWEYVARAGTSTALQLLETIWIASSLTNYAWYAPNASLTVHPVGVKLPNPWGFLRHRRKRVGMVCGLLRNIARRHSG